MKIENGLILFYLCMFFMATDYNCYSEEPDDNRIIYECFLH